MHRLIRWFCCILLTSSLAGAAPVAAQDVFTAPDAGATETDPTGPEYYDAGTLDLTLTGAINGLLYPQIEPGVELGLFDVSEDFTVSVGGSVSLGYCIGCFLVDLVSAGQLRLRARNLIATGRLAVHFPVLSRILELPELDISAGLVVLPGVNTVRWIVPEGGASASVRSLYFGIGPQASARYLLRKNLFVWVNYRLLLSTSWNRGTVEIDGITYDVSSVDAGILRGSLYSVGVGLRF
ncbi:MAG: hypothetical protein AAGI01_08470 [Myxococcota bacterium]